MNKQSTAITVVLIVLLVIAVFIVKNLLGGQSQLVDPFLQKTGDVAGPSASPLYNPPQEVKYDGTTGLKQELESINPVVEESDFAGL